MKVEVILLLFTFIFSKRPALSRKFFEDLKSMNSTWNVVDFENCHFKSWTLEELKATFGK